MKSIWCCIKKIEAIEQMAFHLIFLVMLIESIEKYFGTAILQNVTACSIATVKQYFTSLCGCV
jgi:hypothetical protein